MIKNSSDLNFFRFKKFNSKDYLLTNDTGHFIFLSNAEFEILKNKPEGLSPATYKKLLDNYFINTNDKQEEFIKLYKKKNHFVSAGPSLHIIVLTLRCDHGCVYCHASRQNVDKKEFDMSNETAEKVIEFLLNTTAQTICIEFQGGEPLLNFDVLKHIVEYTNKKNTDKNIIFSVVTNLSTMDDDRLEFLLANRVSICTSLDGPEDLHNKNRPLKDKNSFKNTLDWISKINEENKKRDTANELYNKVNALLTTTRETITHYKEIIDLYVELGFESIHLRPLNPFGYGKNLRKSLLYTPEEFIDFYTKSMDYILELNKKGINFHEKTAQIILTKIINKIDANFLDLRSPCGAGIGQIAYNYDGNVFTCDEGRMVYEMGDDIFLMGNVHESTYSEVMNSDIINTLCLASCLEGNPGCHDCVYNTYCGVCPVYNYKEQGNIFGQMPTNERCIILKGIFHYLFSRLDENYEIFKNYLKR